jgi:hypothetical protein
MADKYVYNNDGVLTEREAAASSAGAADSGEIVALNGSGKIDSTMLDVADEDYTMTAGEDISAGDLVCVIDDSGAKVVKADATNGTARRAMGYAKEAITNGNTGTCRLGNGVNTNVSGLTIGARQYLSKTAGAITEDVSAFSGGDIIQPVGYAKSATELIYIDNTAGVIVTA